MNRNWIQNLENMIDKNKIFEKDVQKKENFKDVCNGLIKKDYRINNYVKDPIIIDNYKKEKIKELYEWQDECLIELKKVNWDKGENFICVAPTSGGKTLVTELYIFEEIKNCKKIFFIFPLNSLINEKMTYLKNICKNTNIKIGNEIEENDIILCTYEKFNSYLNKNKLIDDNKCIEYNIKNNTPSNCYNNNNNNSKVLKNNNFIVIIDEFHHINEKGRGIYIENIVSKILYMNKKVCHIKIICMSGTLNNISILKKWMKAKCYISSYRPQEIKEHYVCNFNVYKKKVLDGKFYNACNIFRFHDICYDKNLQKEESTSSFQSHMMDQNNMINMKKGSQQYGNKNMYIHNNNNNNNKNDVVMLHSSHIYMGDHQEERKQSNGQNKRSSYNRGRSFSYEPNNNKRINYNHSNNYASSNNNTVSYSYFSSVEENDTTSNNNNNNNDNNSDHNNYNYYNSMNSMNNDCRSSYNYNTNYSNYNDMNSSTININMNDNCNQNNYDNNIRSTAQDTIRDNKKQKENYRNENSYSNISGISSYMNNNNMNNNNMNNNNMNNNNMKNNNMNNHNMKNNNMNNSNIVNNHNIVNNNNNMNNHYINSNNIYSDKTRSNMKDSNYISEKNQKDSLNEHTNNLIKENLICEKNSKDSVISFLNKKNQNKNKFNTLNTSLINSLLYFSLHSYINNLNTLIFCSTKKMCEFYVNLINEYLITLRNIAIPENIEIKRKELKEKIYNIDKCIYEKMYKLISNGVCYYYSDISFSIKRLLENAYKEKTLFLLTCTSTLSVGLNLFVDRVIISSPFVAQNFLTNTQYKQMIGRAARLKKGDSFIFVEKEYEKKMLDLFKETYTNIRSTMHDNTFEELEKYIIEFLCLFYENEYVSFYDIIHMFSYSLYYNETVSNTLKQEINASPSIYAYKECKDRIDVPSTSVKKNFDSASTEETTTKRKSQYEDDKNIGRNKYCVDDIYRHNNNNKNKQVDSNNNDNCNNNNDNCNNFKVVYNNDQCLFRHRDVNVTPIRKIDECKKGNKNELLKDNIINKSYSFYFNINLNYFTCDEIIFYHNKKNEIYKVLDTLLQNKCIEIQNEKIKITDFCRSLFISNLNLSIGIDLINEIRMYDKIYLYNNFHLCYICSSYNINIVSFHYELSHIKNLLSLISDQYTKNIIFKILKFDSDIINMLNLKSQQQQKKKTYFSNLQLERKYSKLYLSILLFLYLNEQDIHIICSIYKITPDVLKSILQHTFIHINILISFFDKLNEWILVSLLKKFLQKFKNSKPSFLSSSKFKKVKNFHQK
ncbi:DEAD/DEAH box helicase, putative [Plasmodium sp. gorilla clade G2]|uniref:DEAD/DEAH box helicase, putative n=1 Tax=Plasmodium sp. gorilla clade G2 TaxID=880535 RepID=UPI000D20556B|nr:DEAD/DEAH box helicase, putative [Plasmodium sp. gorilla clade G2]SOV18997.1 DEAD/DEAH box helicase, putative [Plasmodium sp. gorilla clade G2]